MPVERRKRAVPRPARPMEKRLEKQAYKVADSVAYSLFKKHKYFAEKGKLSLNDFKQQAFVGVMNAYTHFDPSRGVDFKTFAFSRARGEVLSMLRERVPMVFVPKKVLRQVSSEKAFGKSISRLYEIALNAKTRGECDSAMKKISELRSARNGIRPQSGDAPIESKGVNGSPLFDLVESKERRANPLDNAMANDLHQYLPKAFDRYLDKRTAYVLKIRYLSKENVPIRAIAQILELSPRVVSYIHNEGLLRLLNSPDFKRALGLPAEKVFSRKDIGAITKRLNSQIREQAS